MEGDVLFSGFYRGPQTFLDTYTFLKFYPHGVCVFAESLDPEYDFAAHLATLEFGEPGKQPPDGFLDDGTTRLSWWGRFTRKKDTPTLNWNGQVVGRLADALELTSLLPFAGEVPSQVEIVGPGRLRPTTHDVDLVFVPDKAPEPERSPGTTPDT